MFKFTAPDLTFDDIEQTENELRRLAVTAPHLLRDVGFARDPHRSNDLRTVWVSDHAEFEILHET